MNMNMKKAIPNLIFAAMMIAAAIGVVFGKSAGLIDGDVGLRLTMMLIGFWLAFYANLAPKAVFRTERTRSVRRLSGWIFVLCGLGYAAVWAFAPFESAPLASMALVGVGFIVVVGSCLWTRHAHTRHSQEARP